MAQWRSEARTKEKYKLDDNRLDHIIQLLPFHEGNMTIYSPSTGNIARGQYYLSRVNKSSYYPQERVVIALLYRYRMFTTATVLTAMTPLEGNITCDGNIQVNLI